MDQRFSDISGRLKAVLCGEYWLDIFLYFLFVSFFIATFVDSPAVRILTSLLYTLLMISGVVSMSHHRTIRIVAGLVAVVAIVLRWLRFVLPTPAVVKLGTLAVLLFMALLIAVTLAKVFGRGPVNRHRIKGAIAVYLLFGMSWALLYGLIDQTFSNAFSPALAGEFTPVRQEALTYFSFITLTTLGYGDITPVHEVARLFAVMEALFGQLYPATLLARLVSLEVSGRTDDKGGTID